MADMTLKQKTLTSREIRAHIWEKKELKRQARFRALQNLE